MAKRAAQGSGTIRKKTVTRSGKEYTYWEARITVGRDPGTGKQVQRSFSGKTQKEVREKMQAAAVELNNGSYQAPCKLTVGQWLDIWTATYLNGVKPRTVEAYSCQIKNHIRPALGAVRLDALTAHTIQQFYNSMGKPSEDKAPLSGKSIRNVHGILHKCLQQAVALGYLRYNPTDACKLPKVEHKELRPLDEDATALFLKAIKGHQYETLFLVTLFTGMRKGEVLGLQWDCVDFKKGTILVNKQLQKTTDGGSTYTLVPTKTSKARSITPAPFVMGLLQEHKRTQTLWQLRAGPVWGNVDNLVFTNEAGCHLCHQTVYLNYKRVVASIGLPDIRFHDLRHSYAVAALLAGDDIKTVQGNLGHATAAFTLDVYGHVTDQMKQASAARMEQYIKRISEA